MDNVDRKTRAEKKGLLAAAATTIGAVAGLVVHSVGVHTEAPSAGTNHPARKGKLPPKHKARLPRRLKKAMQTGRIPAAAS